MPLLSSPLQGQNPFELAFSLDQPHHGDSDFGLQCSARPDMPASQPIDIPDAKKRGKKKKRGRATDSFSGRFEGEQGWRALGEPGAGDSRGPSHARLAARQTSTSCRRMCWGRALMPECRPAST